jgi:NADPH2:quinone reductase
MKAIRVHQTGGPEVLKLEEVPDPAPGAGQVLVEIKAIGVNPVETYIRAGKYPLRAALPYTPGSDAAGIVRGVGSGVHNVKPRDRVYVYGSATGAYAQLCLCEAAQVFLLPEKVSFQQGAAVGVPYGTAWRALFIRAKAFAGETVLIHGASGGVGTAAVQLAKAAGLTVFGTAGSDKGRELVKEQGADQVFDHTSTDSLKRIMDATAGRGVDVIIEMLANVNLNNDLGLLARNGRVIVVGSRGPIEIDPRQTMQKETSILGMSLPSSTPGELHAIHSALGVGLANGTLRPVIGQEFALADASKAHEAVMKSGSHGKIVLIP